jgi:NAD(P)-dependent dehydrogenase (short-subunit alcohol dehydrogenase family)
MIDIKGKTAIVTGAGQGIGREIALSLAEAGVDIAVVDVNSSFYGKSVGNC